MTTVQSAKPFSISFGAKKAKIVAPTHRLGPKKDLKEDQKKGILADGDSDNEEIDVQKIQSVTAFDQAAGGAIAVVSSTRSAKGPLIIQAQRNRDWREESRRRKGQRPPGYRSDGSIKTDAAVERDEISLDAGLKFVVKKEDSVETDVLQAKSDPIKQESVEQRALAALMGEEQKSTLTITKLETPISTGLYGNEDDQYRADVAARPDCATLDDYAAVPVEEFGAALLRGMGWKEGETVGRSNVGPVQKDRIVERRPALLGIGAKEVPNGVGDELGAWGKAGKGRRKADITYNPVLLKNSKTGELVTEEELQRKKDNEAQSALQSKHRRHRSSSPVEPASRRQRSRSRKERHDRKDRDRRRHKDDAR